MVAPISFGSWTSTRIGIRRDQFPGKNRINVLLIGMDYSYLWTKRDPKLSGARYTKNSRADSIMMMSLDLDNGKVSALSIPRDTRITAPDGRTGKINGTFSRGGAPLLRQAVTNLLGVAPDYYIAVKPDAVRDMVNALGGVNVQTKDAMEYNDSAALTQPGAMVKAGEYLLAIDNQPLAGTDNVYRLLEGKGGRAVTLRVAAKPDGTGGRDVEVTPTLNDQALRHHAWVADNRAYVEKQTGGKIAYIYLPNTHGAGHDRFIREFYAQVGKQGAIIDERFNGGGFLADEVIEALNRRVLNYVTMREGADQVHPRGIFGPKVMLINEFAGSGGDYLPYTFRQAKVGTLVGKRTWGGLVGIGGYPTLVDGGAVTAPHMGIWFPNGKWDVENRGVAPDVDVDYDPKIVRNGTDPQLDKAIEIALAELKKHPVTHPKRPAFPDYSGAKKGASGR